MIPAYAAQLAVSGRAAKRHSHAAPQAKASRAKPPQAKASQAKASRAKPPQAKGIAGSGPRRQRPRRQRALQAKVGVAAPGRVGVGRVALASASMSNRYETVSFLSDYGLQDEFVGVTKSVIWSVAPEVRIVDITHNVRAHDVRAGGLALARSAQYLCPGVVLAVVDPGVATSRRGVAVEVGDGMSVLVGPDNGLLAPAVAMVGGASRTFDISSSPAQLPTAGPTFDGRDLFGPVVARLCTGVPLEELGTEMDPNLLMPSIVPVSGREGDDLVTEVLWIDRFGNAQLNLDPDDLPDAPAYRLMVDDRPRIARRRRPDSRQLRHVGAVDRSGFGRSGPGLVRGRFGQDRSPRRRCGLHHACRVGKKRLMRPATTLVLALLLLIIVGATLLQLFVFAR